MEQANLDCGRPGRCQSAIFPGSVHFDYEASTARQQALRLLPPVAGGSPVVVHRRVGRLIIVKMRHIANNRLREWQSNS